MTDSKQPDMPAKGQFLVYQTEDGQVKIDVRLQGETAWLTQAHMADLFQTTVPNISMHLRNIYAEGELQEAATVKKFLMVRPEGGRQVSRKVEHYNLDAIISVGYRVKSAVATRFRIWATQQLREFIVKGFVLDDERLENPIPYLYPQRSTSHQSWATSNVSAQRAAIHQPRATPWELVHPNILEI